MLKKHKKRLSLAYSCGKAWSALRMLCISNEDVAFRIVHSFENLSMIDAERLPEDVGSEFSKLLKILMKAPKRKFKSETLPQANVREMSWKKKQQTAERIAFVCVQVFESWGREQGAA